MEKEPIMQIVYCTVVFPFLEKNKLWRKRDAGKKNKQKTFAQSYNPACLNHNPAFLLAPLITPLTYVWRTQND